jgi:hypothetical protein
MRTTSNTVFIPIKYRFHPIYFLRGFDRIVLNWRIDFFVEANRCNLKCSLSKNGSREFQ